MSTQKLFVEFAVLTMATKAHRNENDDGGDEPHIVILNDDTRESRI